MSKAIATCPRCRNIGAVDQRYCDCPAAVGLRARIDGDPRIQELRARIERMLGAPQPILVQVAPGVAVLHPTTSRREVN